MKKQEMNRFNVIYKADYIGRNPREVYGLLTSHKITSCLRMMKPIYLSLAYLHPVILIQAVNTVSIYLKIQALPVRCVNKQSIIHLSRKVKSSF